MVNVNDSNRYFNDHCNQPDRSVLSIEVCIIDKIYHPSNHPKLRTPQKRKRYFRIGELGTTFSYGCNDQIDSVGNLSSPTVVLWTEWSCLIFHNDVRVDMVIENTHVWTFSFLQSIVFYPVYKNHLDSITFVLDYIFLRLSSLNRLFEEYSNNFVTKSQICINYTLLWWISYGTDYSVQFVHLKRMIFNVISLRLIL